MEEGKLEEKSIDRQARQQKVEADKWGCAKCRIVQVRFAVLSWQAGTELRQERTTTVHYPPRRMLYVQARNQAGDAAHAAGSS